VAGPRRREELLTLCRRRLLGEALRPQAGGDATAAVVDPARERCCPACGSVRLVYAEIPQLRRRLRCTADSS
jgi:hypothetical protein